MKTPTKARILVVDDHPIVRQGVAQLINREQDLTVCGETGDAKTTLEAVHNLKPDLAIIDVSLEGSSGIELIKALRAQYPDFRILTLSMHDEALYAERALRAGAKGYLMKQETIEKMMTAIRQILDGKIYVSEKMNSKILSTFIHGRTNSTEAESPIDRLTDRELEILELIGRGNGTRQIAERLSVSTKTIESHRANLKEKLSLKDAPELMRYAVEWVNIRSL